MKCRLAVSTGCCVNRPFAGILDELHAAGVSAVEVGTPPRHFDPWRTDEVTALGARLKRLDIQPIAIHAPFGGLLDLTDPNPQHRHAAIGAVLSAASALRDVGGSRVVVHVSDVPRAGQNLSERIGHAVDSFRVLARACRYMNVTVVIETPLPHLIGGHPEDFAAILESLDQSRTPVAVCLDTSHTTLGGHWDRFVRVAGPRIIHVHANDHRGHRDDHLRPGDGTIDWTHVRESLEALGFEGWIVLELACPDGAVTSYVETAMRQARTLLAC